MNQYPENKPGALPPVDCGDFTVTVLNFPEATGRNESYRAPFNGYVRFKKRPVKEGGYHGLLNFVPVHGGITFAKDQGEDGMVYGFDCAHIDDETNPFWADPANVEAEARSMGEAILIAARFEDRYLLAATPEERATVLDEYHTACKEKGIKFDLQDNFGAMISCLGGLASP